MIWSSFSYLLNTPSAPHIKTATPGKSKGCFFLTLVFFTICMEARKKYRTLLLSGSNYDSYELPKQLLTRIYKIINQAYLAIYVAAE